MLQRIYDSESGSELVDVLMKYLLVCCLARLTGLQRTPTNRHGLDTKVWPVAVRQVEVCERQLETSRPRLRDLVKLEAGLARQMSRRVRV